jgi:hypothetical protein
MKTSAAAMSSPAATRMRPRTRPDRKGSVTTPTPAHHTTAQRRRAPHVAQRCPPSFPGGDPLASSGSKHSSPEETLWHRQGRNSFPRRGPSGIVRVETFFPGGDPLASSGAKHSSPEGTPAGIGRGETFFPGGDPLASSGSKHSSPEGTPVASAGAKHSSPEGTL